MENNSKNKQVATAGTGKKLRTPKQNADFLEECVYYLMLATLDAGDMGARVKLLSRLQILKQQYLKFGEYELAKEEPDGEEIP